VLGSSAENTMITMSQTKTTPKRRRMSTGLNRNGDASRLEILGVSP